MLKRFPVELFKLAAIQRSCPVISEVHVVMQAMVCLPVGPPDSVNTFGERVIAMAKRATYEAYLNKAGTVALTAQAKAERTLENVAKARRMLANPTLSSGRRAQLVIHRGTRSRDD